MTIMTIMTSKTSNDLYEYSFAIVDLLFLAWNNLKHNLIKWRSNSSDLYEHPMTSDDLYITYERSSVD